MTREPNLRRWFWVGRTQPWEFIVTFRLPWRRRMYEVCNDDFVYAYPRIWFRLRWGVSCDQYVPRRLVRAELPESFNQRG